MNKNFITASTLALVCFIATGCVSDGGSYVARNSGPRFDRVDRNDPGDRSRTAMLVGTEMTAVNTRRDDRRGGDGWDGRRDGNDSRNRDNERDHGAGSCNDRDLDGRWLMRDGQRVWERG